MTTSGSDISADAVVKTEYPPDYVGRNVGQDIGYILKLLWLHLKRDPWVGTLLWVVVLSLSASASFLGLQLVLRMADVTNGLVAQDRAAVVAALGAQAILLGVYFSFHVSSTLADYFARIRIRTVLVSHLVQKWLGNRQLYDPAQASKVDYPEQRVQEDTFNFSSHAVDIIPSLLASGVSLYLYSDQLWTLARPLEVPLPVIGEIVIPKGLYVIAIVSAILVTILSHLFGRVLTRVEVVRLRIEAGFRHDLGMAREYAEQIVLSRGQKVEQARAEHNYTLIRRNWTPYSIYTAILTGIQASSAQIGMFLAPLILFPFVLSGDMKVGDLAIASSAYLSVYLVFASGSRLYLSFAVLRSCALRIHLMDRSLSSDRMSGLVTRTGGEEAFQLDGVEVRTVSGQPLFSLDKLRLGAGDKWLVRGRSGTGKSTLFRVLAGIWPFGSGTITQPHDDDAVMFLPQRPYLPNGTLAELLSYPSPQQSYGVSDYQRVLRDVRLDHLVDDVNTPQEWSKILSGGEQQRIVLARALLRRPRFLFLDEATSSLDPQTEQEVFSQLTEQLSDSSIVTVAHTDRLARYHDRLLQIEDGTASASAINRADGETGPA